MGGSPPDDFRAKLEDFRSRVQANSAELVEAVSLIEEAAAQLDQYSLEQRRLEERLSRVENSVLLRFARTVGFQLGVYRRKLGQSLLKSPLHPVYLKLAARPEGDPVYERWLASKEAQTPSWEWHREESQRWPAHPTISVVMAVHNPERAWLEAAVESVIAQSYPCWELCICDDASPGWVGDYLAKQSVEEPRIRYFLSPDPLGISGTFNRAALLARGGYIGFLDHDDVLSPLALHYIAECVRDRPADAIYTDEDCLDAEGRRVRPSFKPDWSPELLTSCMYWGHFFVMSKARWEELGGFRSEYDGAQDYDAALRLTDKSAEVRHVPRILYHWRQHAGSTASSPKAKPYTQEAGRKALIDAIHRREWTGEVRDGKVANTYDFRRGPGKLKLSFIVCSRNRKLLDRCLQALDAHDSQIVVVHHETSEGDGIGKVIQDHRADTVLFKEEFNFARMNNLGAAAATGDVLFFVNDDVVGISDDWVDRCVGHLARREVGIVGVKLRYPSGAIQHAGVVIGMGDGTGHVGRGVFESDLWPWLNLARNVSAVTAACMGIRRDVFTELGGFDPAFPVNYNDVDLCLRAREKGYEVIYEPRAILRHDECQSRAPGTHLAERLLFSRKWASRLQNPDGYYNPQLALDTEEIKLSS